MFKGNFGNFYILPMHYFNVQTNSTEHHGRVEEKLGITSLPSTLESIIFFLKLKIF